MGAAFDEAGICGDPLGFEEALYGRGGHSDIDFLPDQLLRHAVIVVVDLDMVIDPDGGELPFGILIAGRRQRLHGRPLKGFEGACAAAVEFLERPLIEVGEQCPECGVELLQREELPARLIRPRWENCRAIVGGEVFIGRVRFGFVATGAPDAFLQIVGHQQPGTEPETRRCAHVSRSKWGSCWVQVASVYT